MTPTIRLVYAYRITSRLYFHLPMLFVWFSLRGFGLLETELLLALYGLTLTAMAGAPSRLTARHGAKAVVGSGEALKIAGLVMLALTRSLGPAIVAQVITGVGASMTVGVDSQLIRDRPATPESSPASSRPRSPTCSWP